MSMERLRDFIIEGAVIRTKLNDCPNWVTNVVYSINDEYIEIDIGLEKDYIDNIIMTGDTIKCKYTTEEFEYTLVGWVTRIRTEFPQSLTIKVHDMVKFENKRDSYRFDVYLSSVVKMNSTDKKGIFAILTNISKTGAAVMVREEVEKTLGIEINPDQTFKVYIETYITPQNILIFEASVIRKIPREKGFEYGLKFSDMDIDNERKLIEFINELEGQDKEIYNKRSSFWSKNSKLNNQ